MGKVADSALFAARFRENAARALLLPRRRPGTRTPLWQQRQRSADLLAVASRYGSFPILVETYRECLSDVFDLPALREVLAGVERREIAVHRVETVHASPFASSLLFDYVAAYMYEGDAPLAERRAQALTLDRDLLRELLGQEELRELLDPAALADLELSLQSLSDERRATTVDQLHDLLRRVGDLTEAEVAARSSASPAESATWLGELAAGRRAVTVRIGGELRWIAIEDVARYRDAVGVQPPAGIPLAFLGPTSSALEGLLARFGRTHGPFLTPEPAIRWGLPMGVVEDALGRLLANGCAAAGRVPAGRCRARMVRSGGPPSAPAPIPGSAAPGSRAGRPGGARAVPARLAGRRPAGPARRRAVRGPGPVPRVGRTRASRRGRRPAQWLADPGLDPGARRPAGADPGLPAAAARRARCARRGRLGRAGQSRPGRWPDRPVPTRSRGAPGGRWSGFGRGGGDRAPKRASSRGDPGIPDSPRGLLLPRAPRCGRWRTRPRDARRAVGPRLGRRAHQRHVCTPPGAALGATGARGTATTRPPDQPRSARGGRSLVAGRGLGPPRPTHPDGHRACPRPCPRPARSAWRAHPRSGRRGGDRRRVQRRLSGAARARGGRPGPTRVLRRWTRRRPVLAAGGHRPAALGAGRGREHRPGAGPPAGRGGSGQPVRRRAGLAPPRRRGPASLRPCRRARTSSSSMALPRCTSSGAVGPCRCSRRPTTRPWPGSPCARSVPSSPTAGCASSLSPVSTASRSASRRLDALLLEAGFVPGYRGLALRAR